MSKKNFRISVNPEARLTVDPKARLTASSLTVDPSLRKAAIKVDPSAKLTRMPTPATRKPRKVSQ